MGESVGGGGGAVLYEGIRFREGAFCIPVSILSLFTLRVSISFSTSICSCYCWMMALSSAESLLFELGLGGSGSEPRLLELPGLLVLARDEGLRLTGRCSSTCGPVSGYAKRRVSSILAVVLVHWSAVAKASPYIWSFSPVASKVNVKSEASRKGGVVFGVREGMMFV